VTLHQTYRTKFNNTLVQGINSYRRTFATEGTRSCYKLPVH